MQQILSISQINQYIQSRMDADPMLQNVAVRGEISNYKLYPSGHHYFTLKDESGALKCVMFKGNAFRLRFRPENGMQVIAVGKITVFPRDGAYQLYCMNLTPDGIGDLHAAFEQIKRKLQQQGLFDPAHKKPIPKFPGTIGIVTSSAGAALHDMLRIINTRYPLARVLLLPARVQGEEAPREIAAAIHYANRYQLADVLIVGRGGGSIEDLWAFNEEIVARAIYDSDIPVISAVGHEPDVTISDYVADLRAATPSNAAELVTPDQDALRQTLDGMSATMTTVLNRRINTAQQHLSLLAQCSGLQSPQSYFEQREITLNHLAKRLANGQDGILNRKMLRYTQLTAKLDALSPLKVLSRGYAMVQKQGGEVVRSVQQIHRHDVLSVSFSDGVVTANVDRIEEN